MANFPFHPFDFALVASHFKRGHDDKVERHVVVVDDLLLNHDRYTLVTVNP